MSWVTVICPNCEREQKINGRGTCRGCGAYLINHWSGMRLGVPIPAKDPQATWVKRGKAWVPYEDLPERPVARVYCAGCRLFWEPSPDDWERQNIRICPQCNLRAATRRAESYGPDGATYHAHADGLAAGFPGWEETIADESYSRYQMLNSEWGE